MQQKIVITGGPGTGKTTLIEVLRNLNYTCITEASRELTLDARKRGITQFFTSDPLLFSNLLLKKRKIQYTEASKLSEKLIFFDRGIPDIQAYLNYAKSSYKTDFKYLNNKHPYQKIFITPPWKSIYKTDNERFESFEEALKIHQQIIKTYTDLEYTLVEIPIGSIQKRVEFIKKSLFLNN